jgi:hypothetical protein
MTTVNLIFRLDHIPFILYSSDAAGRAASGTLLVKRA